MTRALLSLGFVVTFAIASSAFALVPVTLQNTTSTYSQAGFNTAQTIDGNLGGLSVVNGWASGNERADEVAVWETAADVPAGIVQFTMTQNFGQELLLGRFRFSITSDNRSTFADGLVNGGDVTATWTVLTSPTVTLPAGMTYTINGDGGFSDSILTAGTIPAQGVYVVTYTAPFGGITGFRLEAITHATLPFSLGPGWNAGSGNFVLQELQVQAPEPAAAMMMMVGGLLVLRRRRKSE